jgi:hypothetical protein
VAFVLPEEEGVEVVVAKLVVVVAGGAEVDEDVEALLDDTLVALLDGGVEDDVVLAELEDVAVEAPLDDVMVDDVDVLVVVEVEPVVTGSIVRPADPWLPAWTESPTYSPLRV